MAWIALIYNMIRNKNVNQVGLMNISLGNIVSNDEIIAIEGWINLGTIFLIILAL